MTAEEDRTRLIGEIVRVLRDDPVPDDARTAALILIGWLARQMPGEPASTDGVREMIRRAAVFEQQPDGAAPAPARSRPSSRRR